MKPQLLVKTTLSQNLMSVRFNGEK